VQENVKWNRGKLQLFSVHHDKWCKLIDSTWKHFWGHGYQAES